MIALLQAILIFLLSFTTIYLAGEKMRENPRVNRFFLNIENSYNKLNNRLEVTSFQDGLLSLRKLYGWISLLFFIVFYFTQRFLSTSLATTFFYIFSFTFIGWFSINWIIQHKNTINKLSRNAILFILSPVILTAFDSILQQDFSSTLFMPITDTFTSLFPSLKSFFQSFGEVYVYPFFASIAVSLLLLLVFMFYYLLMWLISLPIFLLSLAIVGVPIKFANCIAKLSPNNPFSWFAAFILLIATIGLTFL